MFGRNDLMKALKQYYGEYENKYVEAMVIGYLDKKIKETEFKNLLQVIYSYHKANFKAPCIATIKECIDNARLKDKKYEPFKIAVSNTGIYQEYKAGKEQITEEEKQVNLSEFRTQFESKIKRV